MTALERLRAKARASLHAAEAGDDDLARTTRAGQAWERGDMNTASEYLKEEEARATGGEAQLAAQAARQRVIAAIEDEGVEALSEALPCVRREAVQAREKARRRQQEGERAARRARRRAEASLPLFKRLKAGDRVEAKWSKDGAWYEGIVRATMHSGYPNMRAEVTFSGYGNVDEVSWRDVHLLSPAASEAGGSGDDDDDGGSVRSSPSIHRGRPVDSRSPSPSPGAARGARRRDDGGGGDDVEQREKQAARAGAEVEEEEEEEEEEEDTGLLNPALAQRLAAGFEPPPPPPAEGAAAAAAAPAKPLSWKEKALAAQRALKEKRELQQQQEQQGSVLARASQLAKEVEATRVADFMQDGSRPKLSMALKKQTSARK